MLTETNAQRFELQMARIDRLRQKSQAIEKRLDAISNGDSIIIRCVRRLKAKAVASRERIA